MRGLARVEVVRGAGDAATAQRTSNGAAAAAAKQAARRKSDKKPVAQRRGSKGKTEGGEIGRAHV